LGKIKLKDKPWAYKFFILSGG